MLANCVVVADDENLEIARGFGFETIEMSNVVARKVNAGFEFAAAAGADYVAFVGSDDWLHADLFEGFDGESIVTGREITLVDLPRGVLSRMHTTSLHGMIPWLIPTDALAPCGHRPVGEHLTKGLDYSLYRHVRERNWIFRDPHPHTRVDFKTEVNLTPYSFVGRTFGNKPEAPLDELREWYGDELVDLAEEFA